VSCGVRVRVSPLAPFNVMV